MFNIMVLCASIFLSIFVFGSVAAASQACDKVKLERIVGTFQPERIVSGVVESILTPRTVTFASADEKKKIEEGNEKKNGKGKKAPKPPKPPKPPVVTPDPDGDPCYGCWDY
jgi:hypothetical protein